MLTQSKIEVWYKVSGQRILLGEANSGKHMDVLSLWVDLPFDQGSSKQQGYRVSLFDDDGRHIADKRVTQYEAEQILRKRPMLEMCQAINLFNPQTLNPQGNMNHQGRGDQANLAFN